MCCEAPGRIKDHYSKSYQKSKMLPYAYLNLYCSRLHYQCSEFYKTQLSDEAVFARKNITVEPYGAMKYEVNITLLDEVYDKYHNSDSSIIDIIKNLDTMTITDSRESKDEMMESMNQMLEDIKIVEKEPSPPSQLFVNASDDDNDDDDDDDQNKSYEYLQDQSKAINGYVLQV